LTDVVGGVLHPYGVQMTMYLVDREQTTLRALPTSGGPASEPLSIDGTLAGRAFTTLTTQGPGEGGSRLWVPLIDGSDRLGVVEVHLAPGVDPHDPAHREGMTRFVGLFGHVLVSKLPYGDSLRRARRSQPMSVGGELLWRTLPPLTFATETFSLAAVTEPCYDVGGDAFDYAVDNDVARVGIFDAVGHDLGATLIVALTLASTRAARARGADLGEIARAADDTLLGYFDRVVFSTAVLADIDLVRGSVRYVNAGHPPPALVREHKVVGLLDSGRRTPLGVPDRAEEPAEVNLQPGDRLVFFTDGVTEARDSSGERFGLDRLVDFVERQDGAGLSASETVRRLRHSVLAYHGGRLQDDATLMLIEWTPGAWRRSSR
jgi:hypothetical protein